jgi:hypothetical protein
VGARSTALVAISIIVVVGGCESLDGLATSTNATSPESTSDAGHDATSTAKAPLPDAGAMEPFCVRETGKHLLCSDFESPFVLDGVWEATSIDPGATLERVDGHLSSVTSAASGGTGQIDALVLKNFTRRVQKTTLAFDLRIGECTPTVNGNANIASLGQGDPDQKWIVALLLRPGGVVLNTTRCIGTCSGNDYTLTSPPIPNAWSRVAISVDVATSSVSVTVDGKSAVDQKVTLVSGTTNALLLNVGLNVRGPAGDCRMEYDDVTFDVE